jgi:hypothetical protein
MPSYGKQPDDKYSPTHDTYYDQECCKKSSRSRTLTIIVAFLLGALVSYLYIISNKTSICGCDPSDDGDVSSI